MVNIVMSAGSTAGSKHRKNEDHWLAIPKMGLAMVADGMSVTHGDIASEIAGQMIQEYVGSGMTKGQSPDILLREAVLAANFTIHRYSLANPVMMGMGTTVTAALLSSTTLHLAHVGDSRCLRVRPESIEQLTRDHSEQRPSRPLPVLTRSVGIHERVEVDCHSTPLHADDFILLCSDGLSNFVEEREIWRLFKKSHLWESPVSPQSLEAVIKELCASARVRGSDDDITAVIARAQPGEATA